MADRLNHAENSPITREYTPVVVPDVRTRERAPTWAVVVITLAVLVSLVGYPLAAWQYWH